MSPSTKNRPRSRPQGKLVIAQAGCGTHLLALRRLLEGDTLLILFRGKPRHPRIGLYLVHHLLELLLRKVGEQKALLLLVNIFTLGELLDEIKAAVAKLEAHGFAIGRGSTNGRKPMPENLISGIADAPNQGINS